jgi:acyl carrier protein
MSTTSLRDTVSDAINQVLADSGRPKKVFSDGDTITGTIGLDSLDLAVLVVTLEQKLGIDPFRDGARAVPTFREFVSVYEKAKSNAAGNS